MRPQDHTLRIRAYALAAVAAIAAAGLVRAYFVGGPSIAWWVVLAAGLAGSFHYLRRSRK